MKLNIDDLGIVGIIVEDWDITKEFKPKTITTDYSSWICYISRRPVPSNIPITDTYYWKPIFRLDKELAFNYNSFKEHIESIVSSFIHSTTSGTAFDSQFGDSIEIGINQKTLTEAFNRIWEKLEDITGETLQGINMVVTPEYFIGENGADIHITANTVNTSGIFEHIAFYGNGVLITEADNVDYLDYDLHVDETTVIMCKAKILGIEYTRQHIVTHYSSFWLGAGSTYQDVMNVEHIIPITNGMRGAYDVNVSQGQHIIIVVGESLASGFLRADLNGIEIQFTESIIVVDGNSYKVFTSENTYTAGTYNIDING